MSATRHLIQRHSHGRKWLYGASPDYRIISRLHGRQHAEPAFSNGHARRQTQTLNRLVLFYNKLPTLPDTHFLFPMCYLGVT